MVLIIFKSSIKTLSIPSIAVITPSTLIGTITRVVITYGAVPPLKIIQKNTDITASGIVFIMLITGLKKHIVSFFHIYNNPIKSAITNEIATLTVILSKVTPKTFKLEKTNNPKKALIIDVMCGKMAGSFLIDAYISHIPKIIMMVIQAYIIFLSVEILIW